MRRTTLLLVAVAASITTTRAANGLSIPVANAGFETPAVADGTNALGVGSPWTVSRGGDVPLPLTENPAGIGIGVIDGEQRIRLSTGPYGSAIFIEQVLSATYVANTVYAFAITPIDFDGNLVPQFQILLNGLAFRTINSSALPDTLGREIAVSGTILPGDPLIGTSIEIGVGVFGQSGNFGAVSFDRARVWSIPIPEPSTAILLTCGLLLLGLNRRA